MAPSKVYRILRLDDEGFWTDMPGGKDFLDLHEAKAECCHYHAASRQRARVVDSDAHCHLDTKLVPIEDVSRINRAGS